MRMRLVIAILSLSALVWVGYAGRRNVLSFTVDACQVAQSLADNPFPCLSVSWADGVAVLRVPTSATHIVVSPLRDIVGLESPLLRDGAGREFIQHALGARGHVLQSASGLRSEADVGLAINAKRARSQDLLHAHLDCLRPSVREALRTASRPLSSNWTTLPFTLAGNPVYVLRVGPSDLKTFNPFAMLQALPGQGLKENSFALVSDINPANPGVLVIALMDPVRGSEELLDHNCAIASEPAIGSAARLSSR